MTFVAPAMTVMEGDGIVEVCAEIVAPSERVLGRNVTVALQVNIGRHISM